MKKLIPIITMPTWWVTDDTNYGSLFQAYALQKILRSEGYEPEWVQYDIPEVNDKLSFRWQQLYRCLRWPRRLIGRSKRQKVHKSFKASHPRYFEEFIRTRLSVSETVFKSEEELRAWYVDCYAAIVGSDQMWISSQPHYFLSFVPAYKRVAYAVSAPWGQRNKTWKENLKSGSSQIPALSVREKEGVDLLYHMGVKHAVQTLDPVLLLDSRMWYELAKERSSNCRTSGPYALGYFLNGYCLDDICWQGIKRFIKDKNYLLKAIPNQGTEAFLPADVMIAPPPAEFLALFRDCECVITNSFHAAVFAIIFEKQFVIIPQRRERVHQNARFHSLLRMLGISNRMVKVNEDIANLMEEKIEYCAVHARLQALRSSSMKFLKGNLEKIENFDCN